MLNISQKKILRIQFVFIFDKNVLKIKDYEKVYFYVACFLYGFTFL
ncbi:hypothetical protein CCAN11_1860016 [Capnocytophaga canimorsus]|uniref:Uncharacterized protein n=1 Tax=Capnocytophaga canimorsus TaxID=28188 RepID=A0A0B7IG87_9FLAO|nr:hypothetical protein CCAN11_1860016 [Capnocytophaga canimorsus]